MAINADILRSKFGFNDPNVIQGILSDPGQVARYEREYQGIINPGASTSTSSATVAGIDPIEQAKKLNEFYISQNQPAISSLQSSIPEVQGAYNTQASYLKGQEAPLTERYKNLIQQITDTYGQQIKTTQTSQSQELGRRGIYGGGLWDTSIQNAINPLAQSQATNLANVGISREQDLASLLNQQNTLTGQSVSDVRGIQNLIAQLQAGDAPGAVTAAQNIINAAQSAKQFDIGTELEKQQMAFEQQQASQPNYSLAQLGNLAYLFNPQTGALNSTGVSLKQAGGGDTLGLFKT